MRKISKNKNTIFIVIHLFGFYFHLFFIVDEIIIDVDYSKFM